MFDEEDVEGAIEEILMVIDVEGRRTSLTKLRSAVAATTPSSRLRGGSAPEFTNLQSLS
jgi:hypothetical protein